MRADTQLNILCSHSQPGQQPLIITKLTGWMKAKAGQSYAVIIPFICLITVRDILVRKYQAKSESGAYQTKFYNYYSTILYFLHMVL